MNMGSFGLQHMLRKTERQETGSGVASSDAVQLIRKTGGPSVSKQP